MSVPKIIHEIDEVIRDTHTLREKKIKRLQNLAMTCWNEVIPGYSTATSKELESDEIQKCWANVRDEVEKYETRAKILYVLDWPASSGNFYWVK